MKKPFYGWAITGGGALGNVLQGGLIFWSMGIYTSTFEDQFSQPRARITLIETFLTVAVNLMSPLIGLWVDKGSARAVVVTGTTALGSGLILISLAGTLVHIWLVFALLIPLGALALGVIPSTALISRWFRRRRGLALGISVTGSSIGGALAPPLLTYLFMAYGWRSALLGTGLAVIALGLVFYRVLVNYPEDVGLEPEPEADRISSGAGHSLGQADRWDWSVRQILATPSFWLQTLISGSLLAVTLGLLANLSLHAKDLGYVGQQAALLYTTISFCSFFGKIASGGLIDRLGVRVTGWVTALALLSGLQCFLWLDGYAGLIGACLLVGIGFGGVTPLWTNMAARGFGARSVGRTLGVMNPLHIPITAPSAPLAGYISDTTGSYALVFMVYSGLVLVAASALVFLRPPRVPDSPG
ncbi:MAG: MFS transporter [Xanthomonadales bacterium]|nr:MFS transporter [Xanthomonadales bacterium]